jgi:two-component system chemotaxis response regulator CheY
MTDYHLLLAEDQPTMRDTQRRLLAAMGFGHVTGVRNGEEAWTALCNGRFDLVLCDWNMPRLDGLGLLKRVREVPDMAQLPFILITGENTGDHVRAARSLGVTDFIVKPFSAVTLEQRIRRALQQAQTRQQTD